MVDVEDTVRRHPHITREFLEWQQDPNRVGMKRNASHPDWLRSYQKKPRIQKRSTLP
jgi:hypothetical protein